jgi:membrane protein YqaA with SNARE-associated domain
MTDQIEPPKTAPAAAAPHWTARLARNRGGLAALSMAESTVVPIPLETIVAPLMVGHHRQALGIATAIWLGALAGASAFYFIGLLLYDPVVAPILSWLGLLDGLQAATADLTERNLFWAVFLVSFSPVPMQFATLGAGAVGGDFAVFFAAIALSRGLRYYGLAVLAQILGPRVAQLGMPKGRLVLWLFLVLAVVWGLAQLL